MTPRGPRPPGAGPLSWRASGFVFAVALALRIAHVLWLRDNSPYFTRPVLDAETYYWAARGLAAGEGWAERVYWQPPGYPHFLAAIFAITGPSLLAARLAQAVLGALTATLTAAAGARLLGPGVGLGAGLVVATYGTLVYFDGELLTPALALCLQMATVYCAVRARADASGRSWLAAGLLGGLTAVVNATALVMVPVLALAARRRAAWLLVGVAVAIAPVTLRNRLQGGEWVLISSNAGINLYLGNNPRHDATAGLRPGRDWQALLRAPRLHGIAGAGPASRFFTSRVLAYARRDPGGFVALQGRKLWLLVRGTETPRNQAIYPARAWSPVLWALLWQAPGLAVPFGLLFPVAAVGLGVLWRRVPLLGGLVGALALAVVAFFVTARYRAALVPFLALFAAAGVRWAIVDARAGGRAAAGAVALAAALAANLGLGPMPSRMNPDAEHGLAHWLELEGRRPEALVLYARLARESPQSFDPWYGVLQLASALGRPEEAARALAAIRALEPEFPDTALLLADAAIRAGCPAEAARFAARGLALEPTSALARDLLRRAETLRAARPGGLPGGCPDHVFVAPFTLARVPPPS